MTSPLPMSPRKLRARMKLLHLLPRTRLEQLSRRPNPCLSDRRTLEIELANSWRGDEIEGSVAKIFADARGAM